jgi:hypothetical protein
MHTDQGKARHIMLKAHFRGPAILAVALIAGLALLARMNIIGLVTIYALATQRLVTKLAPMACTTILVSMLTAQREICFPVMVKLYLFPSTGLVAGIALLPILPLVIVVTLVTRHAIRPQVIRHHVAAMTCFAFHIAVIPRQREICLCMVEADFLPARFTMAVVAVRPVISGMCII